MGKYMYTIDTDDLKMRIALLCKFFGFENQTQNTDERLEYFSTLVIDCAVQALNNKKDKIDTVLDAMIVQYQNEEPLFYELCPLIAQLVHDVKMQFYTSGFDPRLMYKVVTKKFGLRKVCTIIMDLEMTVLVFNSNSDNNDISHCVEDHPNIEVLNELFKGQCPIN
ncbi:hypothetical protein [Aeromonas phage ZPAH34]|uniref:hypothetical protein n=1 Tax=Aeromonas phage ZPAH34 TaxID=2924888 RepID=UPI002329550F|nr:hypothetical protein PQD16_gp024 [Aeromonas phage ZPAH34]UOX39659.1 hypothetical protein [Aeromonas phage ZPAH34]